jgi:hypothetical protein
MEDIILNPGWESLYRMSYPDIQTITPVSYLEPSIVTTDVQTSSSANGNAIIKILVLGGLIYVVYHLANYYSKLQKREERKKQLLQ